MFSIKWLQAGKLPFGQLPVLEVEEGVFIAQSAAIMRYIGKKTGLYPLDDVKAALVDSIIDEVLYIW
jgi:glutathione S-transferase